MNRRILPLSLMFTSAVVVYACGSVDNEATPNSALVDEAGTPIDSPDASKSDTGIGSSTPDGGDAETSTPSSDNPLDGVGTPETVGGPDLANVYVEGPQWVGDGLYFSQYGSGGAISKFTPPNNFVIVRKAGLGTLPLGMTYDRKDKSLLTIEVNDNAPGAKLVRTPVTGSTTITLGAEDPPRVGTPIVLTTDAGGAPPFDSPNDLVVRKSDGTIYITDPGYQNPGTITNHIWRVKPMTNEVVETVAPGRPNGIALSPDDSILYVSFTNPTGDVAPTVMKYPITAATGALGVPTKLADIPPGGPQADSMHSAADGLAVDSSGNIYVATKTGVEVFKPDGTKWGKITTDIPISAVAFGGADRKTLFMSSKSGMQTVTVKVAGISPI